MAKNAMDIKMPVVIGIMLTNGRENFSRVIR